VNRRNRRSLNPDRGWKAAPTDQLAVHSPATSSGQAGSRGLLGN